jgi:hypothetical protein
MAMSDLISWMKIAKLTQPTCVPQRLRTGPAQAKGVLPVRRRDEHQPLFPYVPTNRALCKACTVGFCVLKRVGSMMGALS